MDETKAGQSGGVNLNADDAVNVGRDVAGRDIIYNVQGVDPTVLKALEAQINQFLADSARLQQQLDEWKDLHNDLHDLYIRFGTVRSAVPELSEKEEGGLSALFGNAGARRDRLDRLLFGVSTNWQQCKTTLDKLRLLTSGLDFIGPAHDPDAPPEPDPLKMLDRLKHLQLELDGALNESDRYTLADVIGQFAHEVDEYLYQVDKALRDVAKAINQLPQQIRLMSKA